METPERTSMDEIEKTLIPREEELPEKEEEDLDEDSEDEDEDED